MIKNLFNSLVLLLLLFTSCGDEATDKTQYRDGVVVVNQGLFQSGTGTLTFKENGSDSLIQNAFTINNGGAFLGNVAQSMIEHMEKNYISINNGGKVVVTNKDDFSLIDTLGNIQQGRYFASNGDKLYLSSWGDTGSNGGIYEIDGATNTVTSFIDLGNGPEGLLFVDNLLYIAKGGGFGRDSLLLILDPTDNSILKSIPVGDNPELIVKDNDDNIYVICNGYTDWNEPANSTLGRLVKITNQEIVSSIEIPTGSNRLTIDKDNEFVYFVSEGNVVKQDINAASLQTKVIKNVSAYALGYDDGEQKLYIGDAKDFSSQGEVFVFSKDDVELESFTAGIIPGYFFFN